MSQRKRGRGGAPALYEHRPDRSTVVRISEDGRRTREQVVNDFVTNAALEGNDWDYSMGDDSLPVDAEDDENDGITVRVKAKRYKNSDLPFLTWVDHRDEYLDEMLRLEGRGEAAIFGTCGTCGESDPHYRCENQTCYGTQLFCRTCIVLRHEVLPTHWVQEWTGSFFKRVGLAELGLVVQLGHTPGSGCTSMRLGKKKFTLIDVTGIHNVAVQFCQCDSRITHRQQLMRACWWPATARDPSTCATFGVLRLFQNMNSLGKISGFHFLRSLELLTNADGLNPPANRRRAFMYIVRQHCMMEMMKRAGRAHAESGVRGTAQGELALACRACPQPGKNLPEGWDKIDWSTMPEDLRYKYFLFLAQDCNFRLINRDISTEARDPIIDDGLGYFCNRAEYKKYIAEHVGEEEISTCSGFQAMFLANAKRVKGLRTTGVGGVTCARHNMWRANGIGDLQNGERYCNMDFILFSAIINTIILYLILSYDIACQYSKKFWTRMTGLPSAMHIDKSKVAVWFKVPNFHMLGHRDPCHSPFSFHWMWGAGVTDGEDVEQNWISRMGRQDHEDDGPGARHAFLEGLFGFHNWMRTVSYRKVFAQRLARDLKEAKRHKDAFDAFSAVIGGEQPQLLAKWKGWVKDWESEQHTEAADSPFEMTKPVNAMKEIRAHLTIDIKAAPSPTALQELDLVKRKTALLKKINRFRKLQRTYMPDLVRYMTAAQREMWDDKTRGPEAIKLFLPSELGAEARRQACENGLAQIEEEMREAELKETLEDLRQALRTRTLTDRFRHRNTTGQRALTRAKESCDKSRFGSTKQSFAIGHGDWEKTYRVLEESDVRGVNERAVTEEEMAERERLRELGEIVEGGIAAAGVVAAGETTRTMSWIWYSTNLQNGEADLIEALRVEWCKAYAKTSRWHEDIVIVDEEMHRTIEYGAWMAAEWERWASARTAVSPELAEGLRALRGRAKDYLAGVRGQGGEVVVEIDPDEGDDGDVDGDENVDGEGEEELEDDEDDE
ncbi:hypothetical protein B0H13DRAFT_2307333 [Mycena leptocephala]|nr:hypothetical protein B0H13DRAFT_2307333 [Mycena leptocephala]